MTIAAYSIIFAIRRRRYIAFGMTRFDWPRRAFILQLYAAADGDIDTLPSRFPTERRFATLRLSGFMAVFSLGVDTVSSRQRRQG